MSYSLSNFNFDGVTAVAQQANDLADKYAAQLAAGQLKPARNEIGGACKDGGCAFSLTDFSRLYIVKRQTGATLIPSGYNMSVGGPGVIIWNGSKDSAPWPGIGAVPILPPSGMTPEEEAAILAQYAPEPEPEPSFIRRNAKPLIIGGGSLFIGMLALVIFVTGD